MAKQPLKHHFQRRRGREEKHGSADDLHFAVRMAGYPVEIDPLQPAVGIKENKPSSTRMGDGQIALARGVRSRRESEFEGQRFRQSFEVGQHGAPRVHRRCRNITEKRGNASSCIREGLIFFLQFRRCSTAPIPMIGAGIGGLVKFSRRYQGQHDGGTESGKGIVRPAAFRILIA